MGKIPKHLRKTRKTLENLGKSIEIRRRVGEKIKENRREFGKNRGKSKKCGESKKMREKLKKFEEKLWKIEGNSGIIKENVENCG